MSRSSEWYLELCEQGLIGNDDPFRNLTDVEPQEEIYGGNPEDLFEIQEEDLYDQAQER